jgi:hypothetical protein
MGNFLSPCDARLKKSKDVEHEKPEVATESVRANQPHTKQDSTPEDQQPLEQRIRVTHIEWHLRDFFEDLDLFEDLDMDLPLLLTRPRRPYGIHFFRTLPIHVPRAPRHFFFIEDFLDFREPDPPIFPNLASAQAYRQRYGWKYFSTRKVPGSTHCQILGSSRALMNVETGTKFLRSSVGVETTHGKPHVMCRKVVFDATHGDGNQRSKVAMKCRVLSSVPNLSVIVFEVQKV